jgi:hypothetical protein
MLSYQANWFRSKPQKIHGIAAEHTYHLGQIETSI